MMGENIKLANKNSAAVGVPIGTLMADIATLRDMDARRTWARTGGTKLDIACTFGTSLCRKARPPNAFVPLEGL